MKEPIVFSDLLLETKDGEWGEGQEAPGHVLCDVIRGTDFADLHSPDIELPQRWIPEHLVERKALKPGDILIETAGGTAKQSTGRTALITEEFLASRGERPVLCSSFARHLRVDRSKAHPVYLYYVLQALYASGYMGVFNLQHTGVSRFQFTAFRTKTRLRLHGDKAQPKIAAILAAYDDLIVNNQRRIALLETMAEEIYREWFVRMRFPGAPYGLSRNNLPADWTLIELPKLASITYGFPFVGERFTDLAIGKKVIRIRDVLEGDSSTYTDEVADDKYVVQAGDLLIGMDGEFHMNHWIAEDAYLVQRTCRIRPKQERLRAYLALALKAPINHYQQIIVGATVGHLGAKHLNAIKLLVPSDDLSPHLETLNGLLDQRILLSSQNLRLAKIRDALLPRLISGKLRVDQLDIQYPPSMMAELAQAA